MKQYQFDFFPMDDEEIADIREAAKEPENYADRVSITLRGYQEGSITGDDKFPGVFKEWERGVKETSIILPTGCGKTVVFGSIIARYNDRFGPRPDGSPRRSLVLAHRDYLLRQAADTLASLGVMSAIEKAEMKARASVFGEPECVIASVQSMQLNKRSKRLLGWPREYFDLIVTDEGHHKDAARYQAIYNHFTAQHRLLVTATPDAIDVESLAYEYSMIDAVKNGYLCPIRVVRADTQIDLSQIRTTAGDLNQADIEAAIQPHIETLANAIKQEIGDRKTIVFTPDVGSAEAMMSALCQLGITTETMSARTPDQARLDILDGYRSGQFQCLTNCAMFTEGFDVPAVSCIVLLRPTKSRPLFVQMVGRGTRPKDPNGPHQDLLVVDFPWNAGKHKLVKATELFDRTTESEELYQEAQRILDIGETDDLMEAISKADEVLTERTRMKVAAAEKRARYRRFVYDPLEIGEILKIPNRHESDRSIKAKASEKQIEILTRWGIVGAETLSRKRASQFMSKLIERREKGLATYKQVAHLIAKGVDPKEARSMRFEEASARLSELFKR